MIIPCFSLELLDIHAVEIDEKHVVHQVGFLCLALIMCVYQMTAYVLYEKKSHLVCCYSISIIFIFFTD